MTGREAAIVRALAEQVRVMTVEQIAGTWWTPTRWGRGRSAAALRRLASEGWLHLQTALARPIQPLGGPLIAWRPGQRRPDLPSVARRLHRRARAEARPVEVVCAAPRGVIRFASGRAPSTKSAQLTHDLHVSEVYLHYRRRGLPEGGWASEDRLPPEWPLRQRPDALLHNAAREWIRAIEYGGDYPAARLRELHEGFARIGLAYEIW